MAEVPYVLAVMVRGVVRYEGTISVITDYGHTDKHKCGHYHKYRDQADACINVAFRRKERTGSYARP